MIEKDILRDKATVEVGEIALLEVVSTTEVGTFLDWGLPKNLLLPFAEQTRELEVGEEVVVFVYLDNTGRPAASMRLDKFARKRPEGGKEELREGEEVELLIYLQTDLGYKAVINGYYLGVIYASDVFQPLAYGQRMPGFIKKLREDGKIDLVLQKPGFRATIEIGTQIVAALKEHGGFLQINEKTTPEIIYERFGVSKKKFKIAIGGLYKKRIIRIEEDGIYLCD